MRSSLPGEHPLVAAVRVLLHAAVLAQSHRDGCRIELLAHLMQTGECDELTVAQEVLGEERGGGIHLVRRVSLFLHIEVGDEERFGQIAVGVSQLLRTVAAGGRHDVAVIESVSGEAVDVVLLGTLGDVVVAIHHKRLGCPGVALVVVERIEVFVPVEQPVGGALVHQSVADGGDRAAFQRFDGQQQVRFRSGGRFHGRGNHIGTLQVLVRSLAVVDGVIVRAGSQCHTTGNQGCKDAGQQIVLIHN